MASSRPDGAVLTSHESPYRTTHSSESRFSLLHTWPTPARSQGPETSSLGARPQETGRGGRGPPGLRGHAGTSRDMALKAFDISQAAVDTWRGSTTPTRRDFLCAISLNRTLSDVSLCVQRRKPFDALAKGPVVGDGRTGTILNDHLDGEPRHQSSPGQYDRQQVQVKSGMGEGARPEAV